MICFDQTNIVKLWKNRRRTNPKGELEREREREEVRFTKGMDQSPKSRNFSQKGGIDVSGEREKMCRREEREREA